MPRHRLRILYLTAANAEEQLMVWSDDDPRAALQIGDVVVADGVSYVVTAVEMERDHERRLRPASYLVERA
jgi:hypothetical protein